MKILVTGGGGFIGSNFVRHLNETNPTFEVTVLDDFSTGLESNLSELSVRITKGSILDLDILEEASEGADYIVHLAAIGSVPRSISFPRPTHDANVTGTMNVLEAARLSGAEGFLLASSSSVYGSNPKLPRSEDDWTRPMSPYAASKLAAESYALAYSEAYGLKTAAFRLFNVYGPGQRADHPYAAVIPRFIRAALSHDPLQIHGDGLQTRDFTFVDSVCEAFSRVIRGRLGFNQPVNLAFGERITVLELVQTLEEILARKLAVTYTDRRKADVTASQADTSLLESLLPSIQKYDLEAGLRRTIDWHLAAQ